MPLAVDACFSLLHVMRMILSTGLMRVTCTVHTFNDFNKILFNILCEAYLVNKGIFMFFGCICRC